ncbi:DUF2786 domain-containing protein [Micromonosporaceae bacterium DT55]|uniref:DUF2786 domain-containing protein n=1 Tax=Melissospora conviva TaxID=3388432 RepID=UPI003C1C8A57
MTTPDVEQWLTDAVGALRAGDVRAVESRLDQLYVGGTAADGVVVARLIRTLARLWSYGWQPADVARVAGRRLGPAPARLAVDLIAAQRRGYPEGTVPDWWDAQLAVLEATCWWSSESGYLTERARRDGTDRTDVLRDAVELLALLERLPVIATLSPPPGGAPRRGPAPRTAGGSRMLDRVRALLAKAESSQYPHEAEAFTAKAQELMARHSIDAALLAGAGSGGDVPQAVRLGTDKPYDEAKALLIQQVADANRCRSVWSDDLGFATVLGFPADLEAVELLYTSLLVQATTAMLQGRAQRRGSAGRRTRAYDESFLNAFALRIGERLSQATEAVTQAAGSDLLPVLSSRVQAVEERVEQLFGGTTSKRLSIRDNEGWAGGTAAADRALLSGGTRESIGG